MDFQSFFPPGELTVRNNHTLCRYFSMYNKFYIISLKPVLKINFFFFFLLKTIYIPSTAIEFAHKPFPSISAKDCIIQLLLDFRFAIFNFMTSFSSNCIQVWLFQTSLIKWENFNPTAILSFP